MLFRNAHVKEPVRVIFPKYVQAGAFRHGGGNGHHFPVLLSQFHQGIAEHFGIGGRSLGIGEFLPGGNVEGAGAMESVGPLFRRFVPFPLGGEHMDEHRLIQLLGLFKGFHQGSQVVAVHRSQVFKAEVFEEHPGHKEVLEAVLETAHRPGHTAADGRQPFQEVFHFRFHPGIGGIRPEFRKIGRQGPHVFGNGHFVVIEDHDQLLVEIPGVVQPFHGFPAGKGSVPDDGNHIVVVPGQVPGTGDSQSRRNGGAGVAGAEAVIFAFRPFGEAAEAAVLPESGEFVQPAGQQFVDIGLMAHIPDDLVPRHGKHLMQGDGQFHHSQVGGQMPSVPAGHFQDLLPDFLAQFRQLGIGDFFQVRRCMYGWQEFHKGPSSPVLISSGCTDSG